jgi:hypothetical protein
MKAVEFIRSALNELSYTDPGIRTHLTKLGYKSAGEGGDQTTWLGPDGNILKIFGTHEGQTGFTADHKMFSAWIKYCKAHADNPYIPRYTDWASFEYPKDSGQKYLQIKMEKLSPIRNKTVQAILDNMKWAVEREQSFDDLKAILVKKFGQNVLQSPVLATTALWDIVSHINSVGNKHGWGLDLHADNYMMRGRQIVIVDPWVASS